MAKEPASNKAAAPDVLPWWAASALMGLMIGVGFRFVPEPRTVIWWVLGVVGFGCAVAAEMIMRLVNRLAARR